jgi:hypothetical protein
LAIRNLKNKCIFKSRTFMLFLYFFLNKKLIYLIPEKHLTYKFTIPNMKYKRVKNDGKNMKLIAK